MVMPDLGGIGKSTISEQILAVLETQKNLSVLALDGDPASRGLVNRRQGRETIAISWPDDGSSKAPAILAAVRRVDYAVLDYGANTLATLSVEATIRDLCRSHAGIKVVLFAVGTLGKIGNAQAILRLRRACPELEIVFVKNQKVKGSWSEFKEATEGLPSLKVRQIPNAIVDWLSKYRSAPDEAKEYSRPALVDLAMSPEPGYTIIASYLRAILNDLIEQPVMKSLVDVAPLPDARSIPTGYVLNPGPMTDRRLEAFGRAAAAIRAIGEGPIMDPEDVEDLLEAGRRVNDFRIARYQLDRVTDDERAAEQDRARQ